MEVTDTEVITHLIRFNSRQISLAGQRYTPGTDPSAPNIQIADIITTIDSVGCGAAAAKRFERFIDGLRDAWSYARNYCDNREEIDAKLGELVAAVASLLPRIRSRDALAISEWDRRLANIAEPVEKELSRWRVEEERLSLEANPGVPGRTSALDQMRHKISSISACLRAVSDEREFLSTPSGRVLSDPNLIVTGMWGTGKTHLLCDITRQRHAATLPTLLILAKNFQGTRDLLPGIVSTSVPGASAEDLFDRLQTIGERSGERAIVIVDGVNEGRRAEWKRAVTALLALARTRTHIGIVVSCRTPFERVAMASTDLSHFHKVQHRGFVDQEFDAQAAFFQYYKLPLPEVPLLDDEFSRPLTLKLICQSLQDLTGKKMAKGFSGIASGLRGMTFVLESFVSRVGRTIETEFGLPPNACWWLLKGGSRIGDPRISGFAPHMATILREYVVPRAALAIVAANFPTLSAQRRRALLDALRTNGLIDEDVIWHRVGEQMRPQPVYRLPYQRFSDHLVARHLLEKYLNVSSERSVARSFARGSPLSRIFRLGRFKHEYARAGWAQALITEFPERVKKIVPRTRRELYFFLPQAAQRPDAYYLPFVEGLFWRDPSTFTRATSRLVDAFLSRISRDEYRLLDALVAVATKPRHPYSAKKLFNYLAKMGMPERDLWWSEYLRKDYSSPTIRRLLAWAERLESAEMTEQSALELVTLLSLVLTTVVRRDRDLATRALVVVGERHPRILFEQAIRSLKLNDPYVPERMLAAAYGVTMSLIDDPMAKQLRGQIGWFASQLYRKMFTPRALHRTTHVLRREYALGVIGIARKASLVSLGPSATQYLSQPFAQIPSPFPDVNDVSEEVRDTGGFAMHMDFENYTIGSLISGRGNYQSEHPEYKRVLAQIEWRIHDLGLRRRDFEAIDTQISRGSHSRGRNGDKTDRYGKKYSWIAYFEMYGVRQSLGLLAEIRDKERTSDCDIDPSFPKEPPKWAPPLPDVFASGRVSLSDWIANGPTPEFDFLRVPKINEIEGPWILVDGFVHQNDPNDKLQIWTFLRGLFVKRPDVSKLRKLYLEIDYPGNSSIPSSGEDYYVFCGEIGRSTLYASELLRKDGRYRRQTASAFEEHQWIPDPTDANEVNEAGVKIANVIDGAVTVQFGFPRGRSERIPGVRIEIPLRTYSWESYHSTMNQFSGFDVPAPALIERLKLHTRGRGIDFFDCDDRPATIYREEGSLKEAQRVSLFYMREDLLRSYLRDTRQTIVWCNWGERSRQSDGFESENDAGILSAIQAHQHIHRRFVTLDELMSA